MSGQNFSQQNQPSQAPVGYQHSSLPAPYAPIPPRPPLSPRQKSGAMLAGGVGFTMFALGGSIATAVAMFTLVGGIIAIVFTIIGASGSSGRDTYEEFLAALDSIPVGIVVTVGIVAFVVAIALMIAGVVLSIRILKKHGVSRPVAITWSGLGIGTVAYWVLSSIVSIVPSLLGSLADGAVEAVIAIFMTVLGLGLLVAIGMFTWWWMSHAFRSRDAG